MVSPLAPYIVDAGVIHGVVLSVKQVLVELKLDKKPYGSNVFAEVIEGDKRISFELSPESAKALIEKLESLFL